MKRIAVLTLIALLAACGFRNVERVPPQEADTARPYTSMSKDELHANMQNLAAHARRVNELLRKPVVNDADREDVVAELVAIESIANALSAEDARTVHPTLWKNIEPFRQDVQQALTGARANPPNFFLAGTVTGSCAYCHGPDLGKVH